VASWAEAFRHFGKRFAPEALRAQIGKGSDRYLPEFLTPEEIAKFGDDLDEYRSGIFLERYRAQARPFPKVRELFECIHSAGIPTVLASSGKKSDTEYYLKLLEIGDLIEGCTSADDAGQSKPAPDIFLAALKLLKRTSPKGVLAVGDTRFDVEGAARAGLETIGLTCGGAS